MLIVATMPGIIELATSGRAKCRFCATTLPKGQLRFGERDENPFGDGEVTYWFHLLCGACKRPEAFASAKLPEGEPPTTEELQRFATEGIEHPRLARIKHAERASSARAKCRHCKSAIAKDSWRIALDIWEAGRFNPMGFIHTGCGTQYFSHGGFLERIQHFTPDLDEAAFAEIQAVIEASSLQTREGQ